MLSRLRKTCWNYYYIAVTVGASIITWGIHYLYHPLMIRYLPSDDFAVFQSLMSLFNVFGVIWAWLGLYLTQQVSIHAANNKYLSYIKNVWLRYATHRWVGLFLLFTALSPAIAFYLHLPSLVLVLLVAVNYLTAGYTIVHGALLQGSHKFEYIAWIMIWWALCRIWLGGLAVWLDRWVAWAIAAVSMWSLCAAGLQYLLARNIGKITSQGDVAEKPVADPVYSHLRTLLFFVSASFLTMLLTQVDIFIVQHKFFWNEAGNYVAVSVLAKFVFFIWWAIETVYFPQLAKQRANSVSLVQVRNYILLLVLLIICSLVGTWLVWTQVLYLFKAHLVDYKSWLQPLLLASGALFFFTTIFKLLVSRQEFKTAYLLVGAGIIAMVRLHVAPSSLWSFVSLYEYTMIGLWVCACISFWLVIARNKTLKSV